MAIKSLGKYSSAGYKAVWGRTGKGADAIHPYPQTSLWYGNTGLWAGGKQTGGSLTNVIDYVSIDTTGNAADFGDMVASRDWTCGLSDSHRGLWGGGALQGSPQYANEIDYVVISTSGDASDFGDLTQRRGSPTSASNTTRGLWAGGYGDGSPVPTSGSDYIDYVTIAILGNATDFGDTIISKMSSSGGCADATRAIFYSGYDGVNHANTDNIDYVTIATPGNATDFGNAFEARRGMGGVSNTTRGVFFGGKTGSNTNTIDYITIATTGSAADFGSMTYSTQGCSTCGNGTRAVTAAGQYYVNTMDYVTIATTGNATDFGDLTVGRYGPGACSGA